MGVPARNWAWATALLLCACEGDLGSDLGPNPDTWYPDLPPAADTSVTGPEAAADLPATADAQQGQDQSSTPVDSGPTPDAPRPCASWSNWTCQTDAVYLCKATCTVGGQTLGLNCVSSGNCVCGVSVSPCGPYAYTQPCDACKAAVQQGCCD
jgi:hypothetical protein